MKKITLILVVGLFSCSKQKNEEVINPPKVVIYYQLESVQNTGDSATLGTIHN